jgi:S1-C subfamily serine protease
MAFVFRMLALVTLALVLPLETSSQSPSVLRIRIALTDPERKATPVPRHALLISDNPASAPPRRIVTGLDGTAEVRLRPGTYTVESDQPVTFHGKAYIWVQTVNIVAGRDADLELTLENAEVEAASSTTSGRPPLEADPFSILPQWQESVVALWTPTTHASGFVINSNGLIATNQRVVGTAMSVEVQLTPAVKVPANVLVADPERDIAILWIDPQAIASRRPVPLPCPSAIRPAVAAGQEIFTIGVPFRQSRAMTSGTVSRVDTHSLASDLIVARGSTGGPVFTARGDLIGITSPVEPNDQDSRGSSRIVRSDAACEVAAAAERKMKDTAPPSGTHLPMEPGQPFPVDALKAAVERRAGSLNPYQISSSSFDVAFITPVLTYGAQHQSEQVRRARSEAARKPVAEPLLVRPVLDFANWSDYVEDFPPVLLVRATPKLVEGFWTTVGRFAARTQGVSLPPIKRVKSGFHRLRAFCGDAEVTPIHPFKLERRVSDSEAIYEGLYVFDPGALRPDCGTVKLVLYAEKEPDKADTTVVEPSVIQQIWQDFEPYRAHVR